MIRFNCPSCGVGYRVGDSAAGRSVNCKKCSTAMTVPASNAAETQPSAQQPQGADPNASRCPSCLEPTRSGAQICTGCGYNFRTRSTMQTQVGGHAPASMAVDNPHLTAEDDGPTSLDKLRQATSGTWFRLGAVLGMLVWFIGGGMLVRSEDTSISLILLIPIGYLLVIAICGGIGIWWFTAVRDGSIMAWLCSWIALPAIAYAIFALAVSSPGLIIGGLTGWLIDRKRSIRTPNRAEAQAA